MSTNENAPLQRGGIHKNFEFNYTINQGLAYFISRLSKVKRTGQGKFIAACPCHNDKSPSLGITEKPDGVILINCFGCGASGLDVCQTLDIDPVNLFPSSNNPKYEKQYRSGFSAWQVLYALKSDLIRLLIISSDLKKAEVITTDDRDFISEVILRINSGIQYMDGVK